MPSLQYRHLSSATGGIAFTMRPYLRLGTHAPGAVKGFALVKLLGDHFALGRIRLKTHPLV
jgi:hypothetical protein